MLEDFLFNVEYGIRHILNVEAYDHLLFLVLLAVPYLLNHWKRVFVLVSVFTLGHTVSLVLSAYNIASVNAPLVELLIPITIIIAALFNIFTSGKTVQKEKTGVLFFSTIFFGLIHGLGFAREFHLLVGQSNNKLIPLIEFALGIEIAQIIIVFIILFFGHLFQSLFRFSKRDWVMVISAIIIGLITPILLKNIF